MEEKNIDEVVSNEVEKKTSSKPRKPRTTNSKTSTTKSRTTKTGTKKSSTSKSSTKPKAKTTKATKTTKTTTPRTKKVKEAVEVKKDEVLSETVSQEVAEAKIEEVKEETVVEEVKEETVIVDEKTETVEEKNEVVEETPVIQEYEFEENKYSALTSSNNSLAESLKKDALSYDAKKVEKRAKIQKILVSVVIYAFLILLAIIVIFPFYWMIISSLKTYDEYMLSNPTFWPTVIKLKNYADAYNAANLGTLFLNTVYVGIVSTLLSLVITVLSAFAFARLDFKGRDAIFAFMLATMMIPGELFTITNYQTVVVYLHWKNTYSALIFPFLVSVFYIYLLRQNFKQIPNELYLAAKVDGKSDFSYLLRVMVPLALPSLISITILKMMGAWNSYIWPRLVTDDAAHQLITNGLRGTAFYLDGDNTKVNYPAQMAAVVIVSAPLFVVFICLRKYIMKGVSRSGIKG